VPSLISCFSSLYNSIGHTNYNSPPYSNSSAPLQTSSIPREPQRTFVSLQRFLSFLLAHSYNHSTFCPVYPREPLRTLMILQHSIWRLLASLSVHTILSFQHFLSPQCTSHASCTRLISRAVSKTLGDHGEASTAVSPAVCRQYFSLLVISVSCVLCRACLLLGQLSGTWGHVMSSLCVSSHVFRITLVHL